MIIKSGTFVCLSSQRLSPLAFFGTLEAFEAVELTFVWTMNTQFGMLVLSSFGERTMATPQPKPKTRTTKAKTLNLRVTEEQKSAFEQAAQIKQTKVSSFILSNAYEAAQEVIRHQHVMSVSGDQWNAICHELDNPPKSNPALRKLLKSKSVFENG